MTITYREIDPKNLDEVHTFNLFHEYSWRDSSDTYVPDSEDDRKRKTDRMIERLLSGEKKYHCLAAFDGDKMIGAHFLDRIVIDKQPACHVHGLWVDANYRSKGIAKKLKELGEKWAKDMGSKFMDTNVRVENEKMIALNKQMGYEVARLNFRKKLD